LNLLDAPSENIYPTPLQAAGQDPVFVGRLRRDISQEKGIHLWSVADNVLKGAALNAVQILEYLITQR
jgi:aspartate-semialdehyde dehydrogenase